MGSKIFKKKRGKFDEIREQRKKRRGEVARANALAKRRKREDGTAEHVGEGDETADNIVADGQGNSVAFEDTQGERHVPDEAVFYGLIDPEEQTYWSKVNSTIVSNDFESEEDRYAFIEAVYRESQGKELKLASSQSCSRYLEKIIMLSTPEQLQTFFAKVLGSLTHLVQHRFGSHVCETLFLESEKCLTKGKETQGAGDEVLTIESLFLQAVEELRPNVGYMLTDRFASHAIRVLLLVLSGESLDDTLTKAMLASKKKEKLDAPVTPVTESVTSRSVPKSFRKATSSLTNAAVTSLDATYLRALATHPTGNPVLQLLLKIELAHSDKGRQLTEDSLYHKLISPDSIEGGEGSQFLLGLTYDSTGSHLIEVLIVNSPGRVFKKLYKSVWKDKIASMAKNDTASFVVIRILERLGKDDLADARDMILPDLSKLLNRRRTGVIKSLVDRSVVRDLDLKPIAKAMREACGDDTSAILLRILGIENQPGSAIDATETVGDSKLPKADTHGSLLAQSMIHAPEVSTLIQESLLTVDTHTLLQISRDAAASRVLQSALISSTATVGFRKQVIPRFYDHILELAESPVGSYVIDAVWEGTNGLHFMKEKVAGELAAHESELRESLSGRNVWRNWSMDTYQRRPAEWRALSRGQGQAAASGEAVKTPFQLAQERYNEQKLKKAHQIANPRTVSASA